MSQRTVLITGGAGFIGSHLADELLAHGYRVRALDALIPQVHGEARARPEYLHPDVELMVGDVRDEHAVRRALAGADAVFHFAARVGVGPSMHEMAEYVSVNALGTAVLLESIAENPVGRLVVASSMSVYGEGLYRDAAGGPHEGVERPRAQLRRGDWEVRDAAGTPLVPVPTPEWKTPSLASVYALSQHDQERLALMAGRAYNVPTVALRFFNVYGPRQALSDPCPGVLAVFAARLLNGHPPLVFEDGRQQRDFVHVRDAARACRLALESDEAADQVFNVGSGAAHTIREIAVRVASALHQQGLEPEITGRHRVGDVRNCFADISRARAVLDYEPCVALDEGLAELAEWLAGQAALDRVQEAGAELAERGLTP